MPWQAELPLADIERLTANELPRSIALGDRIVPYVLRRAKRRTIGLTIDHRGLRVGAPARASLREIEALIFKHGEWVAQKLDEWRSRRRAETLQIADGLRLPFLGNSLVIHLATGSNRAQWGHEGQVEGSTAQNLALCLRSAADAPRVLEKALREEARRLFAARLAHYAGWLGLVKAPPLTLSAARTRWGSCSLKSGIRLNWRLIHFPPHIVDYVVAHELAHLREMNHSPRFWAVVGELYPDYKAARAELRNLAATCPRW